ncbi:class I SAM-dependent methyltransferase [Mucilaginibacter myungsuensis]|uniref:Class I SAM-dependent methyltransferase n=1 Tax=Mucilaginibacter myungsuensis TaxID=649104 RepID=A0A929KZT7_9SPHI|nr:class I SAM-dependent methyltransferase [Mucilaginibacter myungsuensis]MBE9663595.1 class I SAM-dependent methyltransferase [Mucilaginibacter myungsuensis]MDN3599081.1 class I SAM-dependent methyltransferase [Mucilaginibacter myungsuensis]
MRDFTSISPSAKSLLLMKGLTDIPFMADAVKLIWGKGTLEALDRNAMNAGFLKRLFHFEIRYKSIDILLDKIKPKNIIELSSGYSFRGLNKVMNNPKITYIDTDLPEVIETKSSLTKSFIEQKQLDLKGHLHTLPLNVLDKQAFLDTVSKFPKGPVTIVNEGLLVYLNTEEKQQLCRNIHQILSERGGYWITGDIYIKKNFPIDTADDGFSDFLKAHNVEDNKFESFEQAEQFFKEQGFIIHKKAQRGLGQLSTIRYAGVARFTGIIAQAARIGKIRDTWALVPAK